MLLTKKLSNLPCSQIPPYPARVPSGQTHATLLIEEAVSVTTHCWDLEQGLLTMQGFLHVSRMQVNWRGQSLSTRHSGSSATTAEKFKHMHWKSQILKLLQSSTYALHKIHSHLQSWDACKHKSPYGLWQYSQHQTHSCQDCKGAGILALWNHCQE